MSRKPHAEPANCVRTRNADAPRYRVVGNCRPSLFVTVTMAAATVILPTPQSALAATQSAPTTARKLDGSTRREVVQALAKALTDDYAYAEAGKKMADAVTGRLSAGAYNKITSGDEFARILQEDIRTVHVDAHLRIGFSAQAMAGSRPPPMQLQNGGIRRLEILAGNIGYMEVDLLPDEANEVIAAAFAFLHNTDGLIIDARGNGGGAPETCALIMSYLSNGPPYTVNTIHWRKGDRIEIFKTTDMGARSYGSSKPVYILTSHRTFSGGEELAYDIQAFKRGQVVGATTGGGANPGGLHVLGHGFTLNLPSGYAVHPVTGKNWEGVGVKPDVEVPPGSALIEAQRLAVTALKGKASDPSTRAMLDGLALELDGEMSTDNSAKPNRLSTPQIVGQYSSPVDFGLTSRPSVLERDGRLYLQEFPNTRMQIPLIPLGGDRYHLEGMPANFMAYFADRDGEVRLMLESTIWPLVVVQKSDH